ncbi:hypothetical protein C8Q78DRAFT_1073306 [Trametes maxima]|nr:hypothetical protein C8Q78DRAFT_1073306 [Trametes maxima]
MKKDEGFMLAMEGRRKGKAEGNSPQSEGLPADVLHAVLRYLQDDKAALLACATTSHLWHDVSCSYLFSSLTVAPAESDGHDFAAFRGFLDARPDVAHAVRELVLERGRVSNDEDSSDDEDSYDDSDDDGSDSDGSGSGGNESGDSESDDSESGDRETDGPGEYNEDDNDEDKRDEDERDEGEDELSDEKRYSDERGEEDSALELSSRSAQVIDVFTLAAIVGNLPRLRTLTLRNLCFTFCKTAEADETLFPPSPTKLPKLVIYSCSERGRGHSCTETLTLFNLLAVLNPEDVQLEPLSLDFRARSHPPFDRKKLLRPLGIRKLTADTRGLHYDGFDQKNRAFLPLFRALRQSLAPGTLASLDLGNVWRMNSLYYEKFMLALGKLITHVSASLLHFRYPLSLCLGAENSPDYWAVLNLQQCTKLTSLLLQVKIWPERSSSKPPSAAVIAILSHISPTLRSITVVVDMCRGVDRVRGPLYDLTDALDEALISVERFPALQRVYVPLRNLSGDDRRRLIMACLDITERTVPKLRARSAVRVQLGFDPTQKF